MRAPFIAAAALLAAAPWLLPTTQEDAEPPLEIVLSIDGHEVEATVGHAFDVEIGDAKHSCLVTVAPTRLLDKSGVSFRYPSYFSYGFDDSEGVVLHTLEGPETLVMLQFFGKQSEAEEMLEAVADSVAEELADYLVEQEELEREVGGGLYGVKHFVVDIAGSSFVQDYLAFESAAGATVLFFQGNLDEDGDLEPECARTWELIAATLRIDD